MYPIFQPNPPSVIDQKETFAAAGFPYLGKGFPKRINIHLSQRRSGRICFQPADGHVLLRAGLGHPRDFDQFSPSLRQLLGLVPSHHEIRKKNFPKLDFFLPGKGNFFLDLKFSEQC